MAKTIDESKCIPHFSNIKNYYCYSVLYEVQTNWYNGAEILWITVDILFSIPLDKNRLHVCSIYLPPNNFKQVSDLFLNNVFIVRDSVLAIGDSKNQ